MVSEGVGELPQAQALIDFVLCSHRVEKIAKCAQLGTTVSKSHIVGSFVSEHFEIEERHIQMDKVLP